MKKDSVSGNESISVIICTANPNDSLKKTLLSVINCTVRPLEIIVVDQSKEDSPLSEAFSAHLTWVKDHETGLSKARNLGIRMSKGDIICFTDDDAYVHEDWLAATLETLSLMEYNTGIAGGKIIPVYDDHNEKWSIPAHWEFILPAYEQGETIGRYRFGLPPGANYSFRRSLFEKIGSFDEAIGPITGRSMQIYGDDADYTMRAMQVGYDIIYNPKSVVYHPVPLQRQTKQFLKNRLFITGITREYLRKKHTHFGYKTRLKNAIKENLIIKKGFAEFRYNFWVLKGRLIFLAKEFMHRVIRK